MNKKYDELREKYDTFIYNAYNIDVKNNLLTITFDFEIKGLEKFNPKLIINLDNIKNIDTHIDIEDSIIKNLAFNMGMVEVISYLKSTCSKNLIVNCGYLNPEQINWFKKLYINGLGEFFYNNNIETNADDFINITTNENLKCDICQSKKVLNGQLIPVGGGKDSNVTMEVLKSLKSENTAFIVGPRGATLDSVKVAGYEKDTIIVDRIIDNRLLELNKKGFLNGHTPFSAMLAFLTTFIAYISSKKYVVLSNETSANEANVVGTNINHQYSKSLEFEDDFRYYSNKYLKTGVEYFSFLRPLTELQIAGLFSRYKQYHKIFKSCNVGSKKNEWCCNCSKCLFVYIILSNFLSDDELIDIFGLNLLDKKELEKTFIELIGKGKNKPFDCVGTYDEINFSLSNYLINKKSKNEQLPFLIKKYFEIEYLNDFNKAQEFKNQNYDKLLKSYAKNNLPEKFEVLLKNELKVL